MKLERIISTRFNRTYFFHIVYEWEDVIARNMALKVVRNFLSLGLFHGAWRRVFGRVDTVPVSKRPSLAFIMAMGLFDDNIAGRSNVLPVIIDFWFRDDDKIKVFAERYAGNPAVIVTSREVFELLRIRCPKLKVFHWALSLPDRYFEMAAFDRWDDRKYDCVMVGRPNVKLTEWVERYRDRHPGFTFVRNARDPMHKLNYVTSSGEVLGDVFSSRAQYFDLLCSAKVGLYSTPSMDGDKKKFNNLDSNGFNQVTPRFLEYIAAGCHVLARYPKNPDTDWYGMSQVAPHIDTYEEFERRMDYALAHRVDHEGYRKFLSRHLTSHRVGELKKILESI